MKKTKKSLALILGLALLLTLISACGKAGGSADPGSPGGSQGSLGSSKKGFGYVASIKPLKLPEGFSGINELCYDGERVYFLAYRDRQIPTGKMYEGTDEEMVYYETQTRIFSMLPDGSELKEIEEYKPIMPEGSHEGMVFSNSIYGMEVTPDGNLVFIERSSGVLYKTGYEDYEYLDVSSLRIISKDGKPIASWDEDEYRKEGGKDEFLYIESFTVCPDGRLAALLSGEKPSLVIFSPELKIEGEVKLEDETWIHGMGISRKNEVFVFHMGYEGTRKLSRIDFENRKLIPYENVNLNFYGIMADADEEFDFYTELGSQSVYGFNIETGEQQFLFNWLELGIAAGGGSFLSLGNGKYLTVAWHYETAEMGVAPESLDLVLVERKPLSEIPEREELTLACIYLGNDDMIAVAEFNKTNPKARIKILDYSIYNTENDYTMGMTKLMTELTAGNVPDMIVENYDLPLRNLAQKGLFLDLMPMIEADKDLGPDSLFEPILKLFLDEGKLYTLYSGFELSTTLAPAGIFEKGKMGFEEVEAALKKLKPGASCFDEGYTAPSYVSMVMNGMDKFVDWKEGKAHFDGEDFINVLKFAKKLPMEIDWSVYGYSGFTDPRERFIKREQLFYQTTVMTNIDEIRALYKLTDGKIVFTGLPGIGSNIVTTSSGISISANCKHPELAWEYVRQRILDDGYGALDENLWIVDKGRWALPLNKTALERYFNSQMTVVKDDAGNERPHGSVGIGYEIPFEVTLYAMSEAEYDFIMSVFDDCILNSHYDEGLIKIINEELEPYIRGAKSLEETVKMIQDRASIYVSEKS